MKEIVIFGTGQTAEIVQCCFSRSNEYNIVAFTVHSKFFIEDKFLGLPVIPFEDLEKLFRNSDFAQFKRPRIYVFLETMPRNATNKIIRRELKANVLRSRTKETNYKIVEV